MAINPGWYVFEIDAVCNNKSNVALFKEEQWFMYCSACIVDKQIPIKSSDYSGV